MTSGAARNSLQRLLIGILLLSVGCGLLRQQTPGVLRPGCEIRVYDLQTGIPLPQVKVTVITLFEGRDTVGCWSFFTDDAGIVVFPSLRFATATRQRSGRYDYVVLLELAGYIVHSQRLVAPFHRIALSRVYMMAYQVRRNCRS